MIYGELKPKSKFLGNSAANQMGGENRVVLLDRPEDGEYAISMPNMWVAGVYSEVEPASVAVAEEREVKSRVYASMQMAFKAIRENLRILARAHTRWEWNLYHLETIK